MDKDKYIRSLENLLIFMCQTYNEQEKVLFSLAKEGNDTLFKLPRIQGTVNTISISQIAEIEFEQPELGFREVREEIIKRREKQSYEEKTKTKEL